MPIEIDFDAAPPSADVLNEKRAQAVAERAAYRKKNIIFTSSLALLVVVYVTFVIKVIIPMMAEAEPDWGMATYFFPYFTFVIFVVGNDLHIKFIEKPSKLLDKTIAGLTEASAVKTNNKQPPDNISRYVTQVAAQGRPLVQAEVDAMNEWLKP
ncbi:MAG: hypothetical protein OEW58_08880 [Gammaproteobacteria bacterium]|nr:hypothetical protein [Gammaproteobacteria bacterium]